MGILRGQGDGQVNFGYGKAIKGMLAPICPRKTDRLKYHMLINCDLS